MIHIAHKIRIYPNNKQCTYIHQAIGAARFVYNWGIDYREQKRTEGVTGLTGYDLINAFTAVKDIDYPWVNKISSDVYKRALINVDQAYQYYFNDKDKTTNFHRAPRHHHKEDCNYFYAGGAHIHIATHRTDMTWQGHFEKDGKYYPATSGKHHYVFIPRMGSVRMATDIRFNGHIDNVYISCKGNRYYASFNMQITEEEYYRTHPNMQISKTDAIGIDLGLTTTLTLSDGVKINSPKPYKTNLGKLKLFSQRLNRKHHPRSRKDAVGGVKKSKNYIKQTIKVGNLHHHIQNIRKDFNQKVSSAIVGTYNHIGMEQVSSRQLGKKNPRTHIAYSDVSWYKLQESIRTKAEWTGTSCVSVGKYYPSTKTCNNCGHIHQDIDITDRTYVCPHCGHTIDRDLGAAINICRESLRIIGVDSTESTPVDSNTNILHLRDGGISVEEIEAGRRLAADINPPMSRGAGSYYNEDPLLTAQEIESVADLTYHPGGEWFPMKIGNQNFAKRQNAKRSKPKAQNLGEHTKAEIDAMPDDDPRKEQIKRMRVERNKKRLRRTDRMHNDYQKQVLLEAATELHEWGYLITPAHMEVCKLYGVHIPHEWTVLSPEEQAAKDAERIRRRRASELKRNEKRKAERRAEKERRESIK